MWVRGRTGKGATRFMVALLSAILISSLALPGGVFAAAKKEWGNGVKIKENAGTPWEMTQFIPDGNGNLYVVWIERQQLEMKMLAQKVGADGRLAWAQPVQVIGGSSFMYGYAPLTVSNDSLIVAWVDNRNKRKPDVFAQRIDANGNKTWGELGATVYVGPGAQDIRAIAADKEGGAIIVWRDDERPGLYMQRLNDNGTRMWAQDGVSLNDLLGIESPADLPYYGYDPTGEWVNIVPDGQGGLYMSWNDLTPGMFGYYEMPSPFPPARDGHIFVQRVGAQGTRVWPLNVSIEVKNMSPEMWMSPLQVSDDNEVIITWSQPQGAPYIERKEGPDMTGYYPNPNANLFATKISLDGEVLWKYDRPLFSRNNEQNYYDSGMPVAVGGGLLYTTTKVRMEERIEKIFGPGGEVVDTYPNQFPVPIGYELTRIDESGKVAWKKILAAPKNGYQYPMPDKSGGFFLLTSSYNEMSPYPSESIKVQRYDGDGKALWGQNGITLSPGPNSMNAGLVPDEKGGLYYGWRFIKLPPQAEPPKNVYYGPYGPEDKTQSDIYVQHIVDDGSGWSDIAVEDWPYAFVDGLAKMDAVQGYAEGDFKPTAHVTRAEFAKMAVIALGIDVESTATAARLKGSDVEGHWSAQYVAKAGAAGVMKGYPNGTFKPDAQITRAEAATIMFRAKNLKSVAEAQSFTDVPISHWAFQGVDGARRLGIVDGYPDGTFRPENHTTRAEAAKMIFSAVNIKE